MLNYLSAAAVNLLLWHRNESTDVSFLGLVHEEQIIRKIVRNSKPEISIQPSRLRIEIAPIFRLVMKLFKVDFNFLFSFYYPLYLSRSKYT